VAFPGRIAVGTWRGRGGKQFWCVHAAERVLVVELEHGEYRRLVLEVPDSEAEDGRIRRAAGLPERDDHGRIDHSGGHGSAIELDAARADHRLQPVVEIRRRGFPARVGRRRVVRAHKELGCPHEVGRLQRTLLGEPSRRLLGRMPSAGAARAIEGAG
jgi:hypothetical protein